MLFDWLIVGQAFTAGLPASYTFSALIYAATWNGSISTSRKHPAKAAMDWLSGGGPTPAFGS
jgi:hypothetical protein